MSSPFKRSMPTLEVLERREVPAGNVTGFVQNGHLILTGDAEANSIEVRSFNFQVRILGQDGTTINGVGAVTFDNAFKDVRINLKGGDDLVELHGSAVISRDLIFKGGGGADALTGMVGADVGRDLLFMGGSGTTQASLDDMIVGRHARFSGKENVSVQSINGTWINGLLKVKSPALVTATLNNTALGRLNVVADGQAGVGMTNVWVGGNARIRGGLGGDLVFMTTGNEILGNLTIETQDGDDGVGPNAQVGGNVFIDLGTGSNQGVLTSDLHVFGNLTILSQGGAVDNWTLEGVDVMGRTQLQTGGGADMVLFNDSVFLGGTTFLSGGGADVVQVSDGNRVTFGGTTLFNLGGGDDALQLGMGIGKADFPSAVTLNGGAGSDTLNDINSDFTQVPVILSF